ncbi:MAG: dihydroorotase [Candidatus Micrarchaeota archaeon]|nr:dihydroorotase [Candidatus Micrarchaeota archaeon]
MLVKNAKFFLDGKITEKDILIDGERIKAVGSFSGEGIDASGYLVLPGLIDSHVHLRDPGATHKEDFHSGTRAAIAGGITTVLDMPNNNPPTTTLERLEEKRAIASKKAVCDYGFHFGAGTNNFEEVKRAKPGSLKVYMGKTTGGLFLPDEKLIFLHFQNFPKEKPIVVHAEDQAIIDTEGRTPLAAQVAVAKAAMLAEKSGRTICIAHASTAREIELAKKWRKSLVETCPHYLFLNQEKIRHLGNFGKVYPPVREEAERKKLWGALDSVDYVSTDHAPHLPEEKEKGAAGFPGLETSLALMLDAYNKKQVGMGWIVSRMCENPARIFNIRGKGKIAPGFQADLVLVDLKKKWKVRAENMQSKCGWTPYEGMGLKGKAAKVIFRGELVLDGEEMVKEMRGKEVMP